MVKKNTCDASKDQVLYFENHYTTEMSFIGLSMFSNLSKFSDTYLNLQTSEIIDIKYSCSLHKIKLTTCFQRSSILLMNLQKTSAKFNLLTFGAVSNKKLVMMARVRYLSENLDNFKHMDLPHS